MGKGSMSIATTALLTAALFIALPPRDVQAQECGDVDNSGAVTATDALLLLRKAVGLNVTLVCAGSGGTTTTTTSSTSSTMSFRDECVDDGFNCADQGFPEGFFCSDRVARCVQCDLGLLVPVPCKNGFTCTAKGICVPAPPRCGDVDHDGAVAATDALLVLRKAVGLDVTLTCAGS